MLVLPVIAISRSDQAGTIAVGTTRCAIAIGLPRASGSSQRDDLPMLGFHFAIRRRPRIIPSRCPNCRKPTNQPPSNRSGTRAGSRPADFRADAHSSKPAFSIVIPPPNVTGVLTLGHVLNNTIQDILARRARMQGFEVLWLPGTDHAGVGTQTAVEKHLRKTEKKTRHDLGREEFLRRVLDWQDKHGGIIIEQLKRLGCSCDWSRQRYTFDDDYVRAVQRVFVDLYGKGLIYRGRRMINWDPAAQTALSDEEVIAKPQKGSLYYVRYEIVEEPGRFLEVATTRPETIMADTAVAVHPNDKRYADLIGKHAWRPLAREKLPIIADEAIDPEFGTGVLKVTPAHDKVDFEIGQRHKLPIIDVLHPGRPDQLSGGAGIGWTRSIRSAQESGGITAGAGIAREDGAARKQRRLQRAQRSSDRAAAERAMVSALSENEGSARRGARSSDSFLSRALGKGLRAMAREHSGLVHQPAGLVGPSHSGVVPETGDRRARRPESEDIYVGSNRRSMRKIGRRIRTRSIPGFRRGSGPTRRWTRKRGGSFIRRLFS